MAEASLRPDQIEDVGAHLANPRHLMRHHPGVGKTPIACFLAYYHWAESGSKTVWIQPKSLLKKNRRELFKFTEFADEDVVILETDHAPAKGWGGPTMVRQKRRRSGEHEDEIVADLIAASASAKVVLCGFRFFTTHWQRLLEVHPEIDLCLVDEAHKAYGSNDSQSTKALYGAMRKITHFAPMTASLMKGKLDTVFPILHLIEPKYYGSYAGFLAQHAGYIDKYNKVLYWVNVDKVKTILERHSTCRTFEEIYGKEAVLLLPPDEVEMSPKVRVKYDEFHALAMLELEDTLLDGSLPGVATIRARQIMAHPETFGIGEGEKTGKDELLEVYADGAGQMLVFSVLVPEQERILKVLRGLGRKAELINGNVSSKRRNEIDLAFNAGEIDDIVAGPECCDCGFNWGSAEQVINISLGYDDTAFFQSFRRGLRGKRDKPLLVRTFAYTDSIDQRILKIVEAKSKLANQTDPTRAVLDFAA